MFRKKVIRLNVPKLQPKIREVVLVRHSRLRSYSKVKKKNRNHFDIQNNEMVPEQ